MIESMCFSWTAEVDASMCWKKRRGIISMSRCETLKRTFGDKGFPYHPWDEFGIFILHEWLIFMASDGFLIG